MPERRIFLLAVIRIDGADTITADQCRMIQTGSQQTLGGKSKMTPGIFDMSLIRKRRHALVHLISLFIPDRRRTGLQRNQMHTATRQPATGGGIIGSDIEFWHAAILDIFLAHAVRTARQVLQLPKGRSRQLHIFYFILVTYLRFAVKRLERGAGREVQYVRTDTPEQRMPGLPDQDLALFPIQRHISLPDTQHRRTGRESSEVDFDLCRRAGRTDIRSGHIHAKTRSKGVETAVGTGIQILTIRIRTLVQRVQVEISVYRSHIDTCIIEEVSTDKTVEFVSKVLLLSCHRKDHADAGQQ